MENCKHSKIELAPGENNKHSWRCSECGDNLIIRVESLPKPTHEEMWERQMGLYEKCQESMGLQTGLLARIAFALEAIAKASGNSKA